jgi:hypothetical protein
MNKPLGMGPGIADTSQAEQLLARLAGVQSEVRSLSSKLMREQSALVTEVAQLLIAPFQGCFATADYQQEWIHFTTESKIKDWNWAKYESTWTDSAGGGGDPPRFVIQSYDRGVILEVTSLPPPLNPSKARSSVPYSVTLTDGPDAEVTSLFTDAPPAHAEELLELLWRTQCVHVLRWLRDFLTEAQKR